MLLMKLVKQLYMQLKILGFEAGDVDYYSCCKGVAAMVAEGYAVPPLHCCTMHLVGMGFSWCER